MPEGPPSKTPGVYVREVTSFPPAVVGVETAVPVFIGYTEKADRDGRAVLFEPTRIGSPAEYREVFGGRHRRTFSVATRGGRHDLVPGIEHFILHDSVTLFFGNGGAGCWIVSVGGYNEAVEKQKLTEGLHAAGGQAGLAMTVIPDAVLLPAADHRAVVRAMLEQAARLQDRVAIVDVHGAAAVADAKHLARIVADFREAVGNAGLSYGVAYLPWLHTKVAGVDDVDYRDFAGHADAEGTLQAALRAEAERRYADDPARKEVVLGRIGAMAQPLSEDAAASLEADLRAALPLLGELERVAAEQSGVLPPSGAMAGVFRRTDASRGVFTAPANVTLEGVEGPTHQLTDEQQGELNLPLDGKAINALREFAGRGTVVLGARTLDGNSRDYRYVKVRRTLIFVEQSIRKALEQFVYAANDGKTWATVVAMTSSFLNGLWSQGAFMGSTPDEAYDVECGLGSTMTPEDILDGYMRVQVSLQIVRPAEFIVLTFTQRMGEGVLA